MPTSVLVLWWIMLVVSIVIVLPVAYYLLERTFRSARHVRDYTAEILEAAEGINRNVVTAIELDRLPAAASQVREALTPVLVEAGDLQRSLRRG